MDELTPVQGICINEVTLEEWGIMASWFVASLRTHPKDWRCPAGWEVCHTSKVKTWDRFTRMLAGAT